MYNDFKKRFQSTKEFKAIEARWYLLRYDGAAADGDKRGILEAINERYLKLKFKEEKPEGVNVQCGE